MRGVLGETASSMPSSDAARPLVVVDGDVLGRARTGDETYWRGLLGAMGSGSALDDAAPFALAVATTRPDLVPGGLPALAVGGRGQLRRLTRDLPASLAAEGAALYHGNYFLPLEVPGRRRWTGRTVVTVHDISFARHREFMPPHDLVAFRTLVPRAMDRADRILTVTEWAKADMVDRYGIDPAKVVVTPNGVDDELSPDGPRAERPPYLLFVGGLQRRKDPVTAVRALGRLRERGTELDLVIVGRDRGERRQVLSEAEARRVADRVEILDYVTRDQLIALYRGAEALLFPTRYEGFGLPVLEAMACGTPVVASAVTSIPEVAGDAAVLVEPMNPEAVAEGVLEAIRDADRLVAAGVARAARFRWSTAAARTAAVYAEVLS